MAGSFYSVGSHQNLSLSIGLSSNQQSKILPQFMTLTCDHGEVSLYDKKEIAIYLLEIFNGYLYMK
jgi:hypothetical protein